MKVLYYNWIQFDNKTNSGGGVNLYQKNIIEGFLKREDYEIFFVSSGREYMNCDKEGAWLQETDNVYGEKCKTFTIINSPILATGDYLGEDDINCYLNDLTLYGILKKFIEEYGPFDVIHFNNFEGLSLHVLDIKHDFPTTKIIYSLHNYYPFCTQVNLWCNGEKNCKDYINGKKCLTCHIENGVSEKIKKKLAITNKYNGSDDEKKNIELENVDIEYASKIKPNDNADVYVKFRNANVEQLNNKVDLILAVSDRTRNIAVSMGIDEKKIITNYIGTKFANVQRIEKKDMADDLFTIVYMGYMRKDKGFYFFLDACEKMETQLAKKMRVIFASRLTDEQAKKRIDKLQKKFGDVVFYDGYTHDNIRDILKKTDLGVVPVLWEDNLPQVAIEMKAYGIPILASDLGGASELSDNELFKFRGGDLEAFNQKLKFLVNNKEMLPKYFGSKYKLLSIDEHVEMLNQIYGEVW